MTIDAAIDLTTGDIADGLGTVDGFELITQRIYLAFNIRAGELWYDPDGGVRYFQDIFRRKEPRLQPVERELRRVAGTIEGVERVVRMDLALDRSTRELSVNAEFLTTAGRITATSESVDFGTDFICLFFSRPSIGLAP